ncbi:hypothetical protein KUH32_12610 [Thalassococcus sp. CAU 1522]|uniref:Na+-dependent transporter n=1 Tax=Thalassococcus arenae TaxID=2851652 RepID=A0ABS6N9D7_9RHOB|nr:hypothetical protein [Thalassococcus arenae]MBV2360620.1 hypothetical protein [Thalassococcus arenae]
MIALLGLAARHGRWMLVAGLAAGLGLPGVAAALKPWLPELVTALMFAAALRIGPDRASGALGALRGLAGMVALYQVVLPLAVAAIALTLGVLETPVAMALLFVAAAAPIAGSPNLTILSGGDPLPALRFLVAATCVLPLTVLPVFALAPALGGAGAVAWAALRLTVVILGATAVAFAIRRFVLPDPGPRGIAAIDGASAILMAVVVVGLMAAAGPTLRSDPVLFLAWLALAFAVNFGLQLMALAALRGHPDATPLAIIAGNRNIALFLVALPPAVFDPLLIFVACYQIPMYLTPLVMGPLYRRLSA